MTDKKNTAEPSGASGGSLAWIPVTERLPDLQWDGFSDIVVVAAGNAYFLGRYYRCDIGDECHECDSDIGERWYIETTAKPTHWMPLPAPPTDAK